MGINCCYQKRGADEQLPNRDPEITEENPKIFPKKQKESNNIGPTEFKREFETFSGYNEKNKIKFSNEIEKNDFNAIFEDSDNSYAQRPVIIKENSLGEKFFIKIFIDYLEFSKKYINEFGIMFRPLIEIQMGTEPPTKLTVIDEEKLNNSEENQLNSTFTTQNSFNYSRSNSHLVMTKEEKTKTFIYKSSKNYVADRKQFYDFIQFTIKNETTDVNENKIIIGENKIPLNLIYEQSAKFDGTIDIFFKCNKYVGNLKMVVMISEKSFDDQVEIFHKLSSGKNIDNSLLNDDEDFGDFNQRTLIIRWDKDIIFYNEIDPEIIREFFLNDENTYQEDIRKTDELLEVEAELIIQNKANLTAEFFKEKFESYLLGDNFIYLYEFFNILYLMIKKQQIDSLLEFFNKMDSNIKSTFYSIPFTCGYNAYIVKIYFTFLCRLRYLVKSSNNIMIRKSYPFDDILLIKEVVEGMSKITDMISNKRVNYNYKIELRECILWCLNMLNDFVTLPDELSSSKKSKEWFDKQVQDEKKIFVNGIEILNKNNIILKTLRAFSNDSCITSGIIRLYRKFIQILTSETPKSIEYKSEKIETKIFSRVLKRSLIVKNESLFLVTLRIIIKNFYHYPEIFQNILIILNKITHDIDSNHKIFIANEINLEELRDLFEFYRGKLRSFYRMVNLNYLNLLGNIADCSNLEHSEEVNKIYSDLSFDIKMFYRVSNFNNKKFQNFKEKKKKYLDIHEIITRIAYQITVNTENIMSLLDSLFYQDLIEFIIHINNSPKIIEESSKSLKRSIETVKKLITSIVENTIRIIYNSLNSDLNETSDRILKNFRDYGISKDTDLFEVFNNSIEFLTRNNCNTTKSKENFEELKSLF